MSTHNIPYQYIKENQINYPKSAAIRFFPRDSKMGSKQPW